MQASSQALEVMARASPWHLEVELSPGQEPEEQGHCPKTGVCHRAAQVAEVGRTGTRKGAHLHLNWAVGMLINHFVMKLPLVSLSGQGKECGPHCLP